MMKTIMMVRTTPMRRMRTNTKSSALKVKKEYVVNTSFFEWNLGQCLVVDELGCDVLIGGPAKQANAIYVLTLC